MSMLEHWRRSPAAELGDALDQELAASSANASPLDQKEWIARAKSVAPDDLPELAALLATVRVKKLEDTRLRVNALERLLPDPRVARALGDFVIAVPFTSNSSMGLWGVVFDVLGRAGDPRALAWIATARSELAVRPAFQTFFEEQLRTLETKLQAAFPKGAPPLADELRPMVAGAKKPAPKPKVVVARDEASLFADVYAHPDDDGPRLVLADLLQERGDPRGEFIMLQCQGGDPKRQRALLKAHGKEWAAELAPYVRGDIEFRRGFPAIATLHFKSAMLAERARDLPGWSTLEEISLTLTPHPIPRSLRAVRVIRGLTDATVRSLLEDCSHLRPRKIVAAHLTPDDVWARFEESPTASELVELEDVSVDGLGASLTRLKKLVEGDKLTEKHLATVRAHPQLVIELERDNVQSRVEIREGKLAVTFTMLMLAEMEPSWADTAEKLVHGWVERRGNELIERLVRPIGLRSIESLTIARRPPDPKLLIASLEKKLEKRVCDAVMPHLDRIETLSTFDLSAIGGPKGERTPRATYVPGPPIMPEIDAYAHLAWCTDGTLFVAQRGLVLLLDAETATFEREVQTPGGAWGAAVVTPDGKTLAWAAPAVAYVVDLQSGGERRKVEHPFGFITEVALSGDGRRLLMLIGDQYRPRKAEVISLAHAKAENLLSRTSIQNGTLSHDGRFAILARGRDIQIVDLDDEGKATATFSKLAVDGQTPCAISPSGKTLTVQTNFQELVVYDFESRAEKARFKLQDRREHACDDRIIAVATNEGILVFDIESGTSSTIRTAPVQRLAIAPDSRRIAARVEGALVIVDLSGKESLRIVCAK